MAKLNVMYGVDRDSDEKGCVEVCPKCGKSEHIEFHSCPYHVNLWDDYEPRCYCCGDCVQQCCDDI